jgi:hypothetical protein
MAMANPMPGWYPDPEAPERQRFWDGNKWTDARAYPVAGADPNAMSGPPTGEVPEEKRKSDPRIVIALIAVLAVVVIVIVFILFDPFSSEEVPAQSPADQVPPADQVVPSVPSPNAVPSPAQ